MSEARGKWRPLVVTAVQPARQCADNVKINQDTGMEQSGAHELAQVRMMTETVPLLPGIQHVRQLETPCAEHADSGSHSV